MTRKTLTETLANLNNPVEVIKGIHVSESDHVYTIVNGESETAYTVKHISLEDIRYIKQFQHKEYIPYS